MGDGPDGRDAIFETAPNLGAALRATRQKLGRSLNDLANATRIKKSYLEAIEEMRIEELPSRPFTIGYVRSYARALGLDGDAAVRRFKYDAPSDAEPLRAPVGVHKHADARIALLAGGGAFVITAVVLWNVIRHAMLEHAPPPPTVAEAPLAPSNAPSTTLAISGARPAPQESTLPTPYVTPGLGAVEPVLTGDPTRKVNPDLKPTIDPAAPPTFVKTGTVYGAPANASSGVVLQAKKPFLLMVRGGDGSVYFAQELKGGEAYRAPALGGVTLEVSNTANVWVYVGGQIHTGFTAPLMGLGAFRAPEAPAPKTAAAKPAAAGAAATATATPPKPAAPKPASAQTAPQKPAA